MTASTFQPIAARPAPVKTDGPVAWITSNLFGKLSTSLGTIAIGLLLLFSLQRLLDWAVVHAVWARDYEACHTAAGACWGVVAEKYRIILFGRYPFEEQWRSLLSVLALLGLLVVSCMRAFWKPWLAALWLAVLALFFILMYGGVLGLPRVET
ncbi:MAG: amino acid ABC transporter permease, partial [Rhodoferax sp.]|nr:amino acid ABC transporter permease [Rhodoferax sp.]